MTRTSRAGFGIAGSKPTRTVGWGASGFAPLAWRMSCLAGWRNRWCLGLERLPWALAGTSLHCWTAASGRRPDLSDRSALLPDLAHVARWEETSERLLVSAPSVDCSHGPLYGFPPTPDTSSPSAGHGSAPPETEHPPSRGRCCLQGSEVFWSWNVHTFKDSDQTHR